MASGALSIHQSNLSFAKMCDLLKVQNGSFYDKFLAGIYDMCSILQNTKLYNCDRVQIGGSLEKGTALIFNFTVRLTVFINCKSYVEFYKKKKKFIESIGTVICNNYMELSHTLHTRNSFQFQIKEQKFYIFPALNLSRDFESDLSRIQYDKVIELAHSQTIHSPQAALKILKSSTSEMADNFIKNQCLFVHRVIMITKHWYNIYVFHMFDFYGRTSVIDYIAAYVALKLKSSRRTNLFRAFEEVLKLLSALDSCTIEFPSISDKFQNELIKRVPPYLLNPVNPYMNKLENIKGKKLRLVMNTAKKSLGIIQSILLRRTYAHQLKGIVELLKLNNFKTDILTRYKVLEEFNPQISDVDEHVYSRIDIHINSFSSSNPEKLVSKHSHPDKARIRDSLLTDSEDSSEASDFSDWMLEQKKSLNKLRVRNFNRFKKHSRMKLLSRSFSNCKSDKNSLHTKPITVQNHQTGLLRNNKQSSDSKSTKQRRNSSYSNDESDDFGYVEDHCSDECWSDVCYEELPMKFVYSPRPANLTIKCECKKECFKFWPNVPNKYVTVKSIDEILLVSSSI